MDLQSQVEMLRTQLATETAKLEEDEAEVRRLQDLVTQKQGETSDLYYSIQEKFGTIFGMVSQDDQLNAMIRATQKMATELEKPDQCLVERENVLGAVKTELAELSAQFDDDYYAEENAHLQAKKEELEKKLAERKLELERCRQKTKEAKEESHRIQEEYYKKALEKQNEMHELQKKILYQKFLNLSKGTGQ